MRNQIIQAGIPFRPVPSCANVSGKCVSAIFQKRKTMHFYAEQSCTSFNGLFFAIAGQLKLPSSQTALLLYLMHHFEHKEKLLPY